MAVEVLEKGKLPQDKVAEFRCKSCKSKLRAKVSDGEVVHDQRDGSFVWIDCPVCKTRNAVTLEAFAK